MKNIKDLTGAMGSRNKVRIFSENSSPVTIGKFG
jgi:hypothetical protein